MKGMVKPDGKNALTHFTIKPKFSNQLPKELVCFAKIWKGEKILSSILFESSMSDANGTMIDKIFSAEDVGTVFSWDQVSEVHRVRNGIYHRNGRIISLLTDFGRINLCYPDFHGDTREVIHYTGSGRRGDQKLDAANQALLDAVGSGVDVPLFNKLAPGRWEFLGHWTIADGGYLYDESQKRMVWRFVLEKRN